MRAFLEVLAFAMFRGLLLSLVFACSSAPPQQTPSPAPPAPAAEAAEASESRGGAVTTNPGASKQEPLSVSLPNSDKPIEKPALVLSIDAAGAVTAHGNSVTDADLGRLLEAAVQSDADMQVILSADNATRHGRIVEILDLAKKHGVKFLALASRK